MTFEPSEVLERSVITKTDPEIFLKARYFLHFKVSNKQPNILGPCLLLLKPGLKTSNGKTF